MHSILEPPTIKPPTIKPLRTVKFDLKNNESQDYTQPKKGKKDNNPNISNHINELSYTNLFKNINNHINDLISYTNLFKSTSIINFVKNININALILLNKNKNILYPNTLIMKLLKILITFNGLEMEKILLILKILIVLVTNMMERTPTNNVIKILVLIDDGPWNF